jgi:hypothetical protein
MNERLQNCDGPEVVSKQYEKAGFVRIAELKDFPLDHSNTVFCKILRE